MSINSYSVRTVLTGVIILSLVTGVFGPSLAYAKDGADDSNTNESSETRDTSEATSETRRQLIDQKRTELQDKLEAREAEVKEKLSTRRETLCKKRETAINKILENSHTRSQKILEHLQSAAQRVKEYYQKKNLQIDNYDALSIAIDEKEAAASAAVDQLSSTTFSCATDDATNPGSVAKLAVASKVEALQAYRDAIRELIKAIKAAHTDAGSTNTGGAQ